MSKLLAVLLTALLSGGQALAAEWSPIKVEDHTVREVDMTSMMRNGPVVTFVARHTFGNLNEYKVGRREAKYLQINYRANCATRTQAQLATEAYSEKMDLISKQQISQPQDLPVTTGSIDEAALNFVCAAGKPR